MSELRGVESEVKRAREQKKASVKYSYASEDHADQA